MSIMLSRFVSNRAYMLENEEDSLRK